VLGGDGGDELFGGYPTYALSDFIRKYGWIPPAAIRLAHRVVSRFSDDASYMPLSFRLQQLSLAWRLPPCDAHYQAKNFLPRELAELILNKDAVNTRQSHLGTPLNFRDIYDKAENSDNIKKQRWIDFNTFLLSGTIPKMERQCMKFSLENRLPYLDNEVIDLSLKTDSKLMVSGLGTKQCLRKLLKKKLGRDAKANPVKQGFTPPTVSLLRNELKEWRRTWLSHPCQYFAPNTMKALDLWKSVGWDIHRLEWHICTLKQWCYYNRIQ